ncbi:YcxB family protein [Roseovarius faecimaris]|uniref:YcxB family protein n=1 Tax=Roseovarius faecimaris TaxID=2494550 RepID=A0A6I6IKW3_9RHOB|nr:hypothetical protein [Roseovarius faecimaris]QGX96922.1 YcxB family protein [Roseovarius faecimaris]
MSDREWSAPYQPTQGEVRQGMKLTSRAIYSGRWRVAAFAYSFVRGAGLALVAYMLAYALAGWLGHRLESRSWLFYTLLAMFFLVVFGLQAAIFWRSARAYLFALTKETPRIRLSARGIRLSSDLSESLTDWRDISDLMTGKGILVAVQGNQGIVIPERLFASQGGDTGGLREALQGWFRAAKAGKLS